MSANAEESALVVLVAALDYIARGWSPIPIPHREKGPLIDAWQDIRVNAETAAGYFNGAKQNVGIILGKASGGLTDLDLDCPEAIAAAPYILPRTAVFGRATKPASHWVYRTNLHETKDRAAIKFMGSDKTGLLEVRMGAGGLASQTVFPPSTHVSGEPIEWAGRGASEIAEIDGDELLQRARRLAAASELARSYPKIGGRHDAAFVLGSFLARCGVSPPLAATFVEAVAAASLQPGDKRRDMARTARDGAAAGKLAGFPLLAKTFGEGAAKKVADWLDYAGEREGHGARGAKGVEPGIVDGDLLAGLVEKSAADPGAPFAPEILASLADLRKTDRAAFEALRAVLKRTGCRVTALDEAIAEETGVASSGRAQTQADILLRLSQDADLFHVSDGTGYADLNINGHRETLPVRSKGFTRWLARAFFDETHGAPNSEALQSALNVIEAKALLDAAERVVHVRVASVDGKLYLDLCDLAWRAVEISAAGWHVVNSPPVRFRRASGALELPEPECGGSIADLEPFLNVRSVRDFVLIVAWTLAALLDHGPYPALSFAGEQGTAKSTVSKILRALIDPNTAPLRALPRNDRELFISATNAHLLVFDNVSGLPPWLSDTLCRLSSGGGFSVRSLWTNNDEVLFDAARPAILNGIGDIITRPDLADRALFITLKLIPDTERRSDSEILAAFEVKRPRILGALMDALAVGLRRLSTTCLSEKPRMADFAVWATACEQAFWKEGTFWAAYSDNLEEVVNTVIEADLVGAAVRQLAMERESWEGTSLGLLSALRGIVDDEGTTRSKDWPNSPEALSNRLRRAATFLRKAGVEVSFRREGKQRTRMITIAAARKKGGGEPSAPSDRPPSRRRPMTTMTYRRTVQGRSRTRRTVRLFAAIQTVRQLSALPIEKSGGGRGGRFGRPAAPYFRWPDTDMSAPALKALAAAKTAAVKITLDGDGLILEADPLPSDLVALLRTVKPDLLRVVAGREAAKIAINATPPPDCLPRRWTEAQDGLRRLVNDGWGDQVALLGWAAEELYRVPPLWSRIDLTGAALLVGYRRVTAVTPDNILIESRPGSQLRFRRIGREHLA